MSTSRSWVRAQHTKGRAGGRMREGAHLLEGGLFNKHSAPPDGREENLVKRQRVSADECLRHGRGGRGVRPRVCGDGRVCLREGAPLGRACTRGKSASLPAPHNDPHLLSHTIPGLEARTFLPPPPAPRFPLSALRPARMDGPAKPTRQVKKEINAEQQRRRRDQHLIEIRKKKVEDQAAKRRDVSARRDPSRLRPRLGSLLTRVRGLLSPPSPSPAPQIETDADEGSELSANVTTAPLVSAARCVRFLVPASH